jgi:ElaB/YqjD/DUF883 family membrane-anchored ribosome-binding protein
VDAHDTPRSDNDQSAVEKAKAVIQQTAGKAGENVQARVAQVSTDAGRTTAEARRAMRESAYTVKEGASDSLIAAAENIRREALKSGNEEVVRQAHQLARSMEKAALYLDSHTFEQIGTDATEVVKANPWQSVGVVFIIGWLLGMLFGGNRRD